MVLNSAALDHPALIDRVAAAYGAQCVVLSMDVRPSADRVWRVWSDAGRLDAEREALEWSREAADRGAGEVMVTAIERDGTGEGLDLALTAALSESLTVPVIASGGCGLARIYQAVSAVASALFLSARSESNAMSLARTTDPIEV